MRIEMLAALPGVAAGAWGLWTAYRFHHPRRHSSTGEQGRHG